jgi:hypothetical protein
MCFFVSIKLVLILLLLQPHYQKLSFFLFRSVFRKEVEEEEESDY